MSFLTISSKNGERKYVFGVSSSSEHSACSYAARAKLENDQQIFVATRGTSLSPLTRTLPIDRMACSLRTACETNSNIRPIVHAVVSRTATFESRNSSSKNGIACSAIGLILATSGPSNIEPNAMTAASRCCH